MVHSSPLLPDEFIINDESPEELHAVPDGQSTGLDFSTRTREGYGAYAAPFDPSKLMSMDEIVERIKLAEQNKTRKSDLIRLKNLQPKNQDQTNYCWMNAPVGSLELRRLVMNESPVILSPASAAARITGFKNVGGWGLDAVKFLSNPDGGGCCPVENWPANAIDRKYDTPANHAIAKKYLFTKWVALDPRNLQQVASLVLRGFPVPVGYDWWGHEVYVCDMVILDGQLCPRIRNSWGIWGDFGFAVLQGQKALPDDAVCCIDALAA